MEQVIIKGDLEALTPQQRIAYYNGLCQSLALNPLTRPFEYLKLSGKLTLYPNKNAAEQIRRQAGVSITDIDARIEGDLYLVKTHASIGDREDVDFGAVNIKGLAGEALGNALKKAVTQSKRRVTFSLCGLGMLDETEIETIPTARRVIVDEDGVIKGEEPFQAQIAAPVDIDAARKRFWGTATRLGYVTERGTVSKARVHTALGLEAREGALSEWMQSEGLSWETVTDHLQAIHAATNPDDLPFENEAAQ